MQVDFYQGARLLGTSATAPYSFVWSGTVAGEYRLTAMATDDCGAMTISKPVAVVVMPAPAAPSGLTVAAAASGLSWKDNAGNESGFRIERSDDNSAFARIANVGANVTTYADVGLTGNRLYYYRVCAYNATGDSAYSNTASARPLR